MTWFSICRSRKALCTLESNQTLTAVWSKRGSNGPSPLFPLHPWTVIVIIIRCSRVGGKNVNYFWGQLSSEHNNYIPICAACIQVFVKGKVIRLFFGSSLQLWRRSRSEYGGCDLSQVSLPRLEGPKSIIGQKLGCIMYCRKAETEKGGNASVCVCVCAPICVYCSVHHAIWNQNPPRSWQQWHQWDKRTETLRQGQAGETVAAQSSGLATDSFRKTQTPWNEELRIKL